MDSDKAGNEEYENATGSGPSWSGAVRGEPWTASGGGAPDGLLLTALSADAAERLLHVTGVEAEGERAIFHGRPTEDAAAADERVAADLYKLGLSGSLIETGRGRASLGVQRPVPPGRDG